MKAFIRTFLLAGSFGAIFSILYFGIVRGFSPLWSGIVGGIVLGLFAAIYTRYRQNRVLDSSPLLNDEVVLREGRATLEELAGWLYLTNRRVLFEGYPTDETSPELSRLFEGQDTDDPKHLISMPILQIEEARAVHPLGIESRLNVVLADGTTRHFGIENLTEWLDDIDTARQKLLDEPRSESVKLFPGE